MAAALGPGQQEQLLKATNTAGATKDGADQNGQLVAASRLAHYIGVDLVGLLFASGNDRRVLHQRHLTNVKQQHHSLGDLIKIEPLTAQYLLQLAQAFDAVVHQLIQQ